MTEKSLHTVGRAIFGTERGLVIQGTGALAKSPLSAFEFDSILQGNKQFQELSGTDFVLFFRRLDDGQSGRQLNLLGILAPCRDAHGRRGFMGTCVALQLDGVPPNQQFSDWSALDVTLKNLIDTLFSMKDPQSKELSWRRILNPTENDRVFPWQTASGETLQLHAGDIVDDDDSTMRAMQALAFKYGTRYSTIIVFDRASRNSVALTDPSVIKAVQSFQSARNQASNVASHPSVPTINQTIKAKNPKSLEAAWREIEYLRDEVSALRREFEATLADQHWTYDDISDTRSSSLTTSFGVFEDQDRTFPMIWIAVAGAAALAVFALIFLLWAFWPSSSPNEQSVNQPADIEEPLDE